MIRELRQLTPAELQHAAFLSGAPPGSGPEEIVRTLARSCGATLWGILPAASEEALIQHAARRLGLSAVAGGPHALRALQRSILTAFLRQGWAAADPARRGEVLARARSAWDPPSFPF